MTDNIKLPPLPKPDTHCFDEDRATDVWSHSQAQMRAYARAAVAADRAQREPNWRHPKVQALIGSDARKCIQIDLMWQILEDPNQEFGPSDMEYWDTIHDRLKGALSTKPAAPQPAPQPAQQPLTDEKDALLRQALDALKQCLGMLEHADCSTGYCCCGSPMDGHSFGDGHSPVDQGAYYQCSAMDSARAAIARATAQANTTDVRLNAQGVPEGWKLVPEEPTEEMLAATSWPGCAKTDYQHMLRAAPQPPRAQPLDLSVMELAESVGLIGPASRADDLHDAIQRFHELIVANASIKASRHFADGLARPAQQERKRRYAQGTALGEFGIIPMCDQVDDEPVKVPGDAISVVGMPEFDALMDHIYENGTASEGVLPLANAFARAILARAIEQAHGIGVQND